MSETGRPGRYSRSFNGLIGAMLITVVAVVAFTVFRGVFSDDGTFEPTPVDYLGLVEQIQDSGFDLVYPATLPPDWVATDTDVTPGDPPDFALSVLTDNREYVGLRVDDGAREDLLESLVDEAYEERDPLVLDAASGDPVATDWDGYGDEGGDTAYATVIGGQQVLVYGSASPEQLAAFIALLTEQPVDQATG